MLPEELYTKKSFRSKKLKREDKLFWSPSHISKHVTRKEKGGYKYMVCLSHLRKILQIFFSEFQKKKKDRFSLKKILTVQQIKLFHISKIIVLK